MMKSLLKNLHLIVLIMMTCVSQMQASEKKVLKFGIHPLYNPQKILEIFGPICNLMTEKTSFKCVLEPAKDYSQYNNKIKEQYYDILSPNPFQTLKSLEFNYEIFGKWSNDELFRGLILVRKDSAIKKISDLKGKKISFPASTALAAAMMPQYDLAEKNLYPNKNYEPLYLGSQDSSILAVYNKTVDAGVTWIPPWKILKEEKPDIENELIVLHETNSLPNNGLIFRANLDDKSKKEISGFFINLNSTVEGKLLLSKVGVNSFESANKKNFEPVREFIKKFENKLGKIPW